jgi:flagellar basal-body rod protein FlgB
MLKEMLFDSTRIPLLTKGLDAYALRHRAISDNVANAETVGYQRRVIEFEERLRLATDKGGMQRTNLTHLGSGGVNPSEIEPRVVVDVQRSDVNDLNNVDIDHEMADMTENHLQFSFASRLAKSYFELLQTSMKGV